MGLQAEPPLRMIQAIAHGAFGVGCALGAVHGLQKEVAKRECFEAFRQREGLGVDELEFVAALLHSTNMH